MPSLVAHAVPAGSIAASPQPVLPAAGGLLLSPWEPADAPALLALYSDPAVQHWHGYRIDSEDEGRMLIGRWAEHWTATTIDATSTAANSRLCVRAGSRRPMSFGCCAGLPTDTA